MPLQWYQLRDPAMIGCFWVAASAASSSKDTLAALDATYPSEPYSSLHQAASPAPLASHSPTAGSTTPAAIMLCSSQSSSGARPQAYKAHSVDSTEQSQSFSWKCGGVAGS